jgi:5-methylcytosine-specific restriction endonuclease McrA
MQGPERLGPFRAEYNRNKKKIMMTQSVCGICGRPVDKTLRYPDPMAPTVDHIVPIAKGGHPSDIDNLQLAHFCCNRAKSDKLTLQAEKVLNETKQTYKGQAGGAAGSPATNRNLPQSRDWAHYKSE